MINGQFLKCNANLIPAIKLLWIEKSLASYFSRLQSSGFSCKGTLMKDALYKGRHTLPTANS